MKKIEKDLGEIFEKYKDKRICVVGTTCCGKTTLQSSFSQSVDMDEVLWPTLSKEEEAYICSKPWTNEIGSFTAKLVKERVNIQTGHPLFSLILVECDVIVYLNISDELLENHCKRRAASFEDAKNVKYAIENSINSTKKNKEIVIIQLVIED